MKTTNWLLIGCLLLVIVGCVSVSSTPFQRLEPQESKALVYVFRPESPIARDGILGVWVNEVKEGKLINSSYLPLAVEPGKVEITIKKDSWPHNHHDTLVLENVAAGRVLYVKATPKLLGAFSLEELDEATGAAEISKTKLYSY
ncbi:DUF2846 domain-containing protein [Desulfurivibrio sp. D14AmB]|uniref:DUF2846 domain-containing protein n=1 Tax=Desulfurivibrio sp. D14AmB TaxID=3374370 RepID=UPI00376EFDA4